MSKFTESVVEETALGWLHGLGYAVLTERTFRHIKTGNPEVANMPPNRSFQWTVKELRSLRSAEFERLGHYTRGQMDALVRQAIAERKLVEFQYQGYTRIGEPHVYGRNGGINQLLVYQVRGGSKSGRLPNWRRVDLLEVSGLHILNETFPGRRASPSGGHSSWDETFAIVS